jgi:hypothetical protein
MKQFWQNDKYQRPVRLSKAEYIRELNKEGLISPKNINALPSYSSIKSVLKDKPVPYSPDTGDIKTFIINKIHAKASKRRKQQWEHQDFDQKLEKKIGGFSHQDKLNFWIEVFLEYYKLLKSENKND